MAQQGTDSKAFLSLLSEVKKFMLSKGEDASLLEEPVWLLDLAFLTDLTEKLNHLNRELQGKDKAVAHKISAVNAFKAKMNIFSAQVEKKKMLHFSSVQAVLKDNVSASAALDEVVTKHSQVINRLGQELEDRFCDFEKLEPCVSFVTNPFMCVDITSTAEQLSDLFSLSATDVEMEILTLQNDINLKAHQSAPNFWCLVDKEKYSGVCTAAMKIASFFGSTYLCKSPFQYELYQKQTQNTLD